MKNSKVKKLTLSAMIAAIYFACAFVEQSFASGAIQCRLSEAFTLLPLLFPEAIIGVTIGCLIFNVTQGIVYDMIFGTLATLLAGVTTYFLGKLVKNDFLKIALGGLPPVLFNAFIVPIILIFGYEVPDSYWYLVLTVGIGQVIAVYVAGGLLYFPIKKALEKFRVINGKEAVNQVEKSKN